MKKEIIIALFVFLISCSSSYAASPITEKWEGKLGGGDGELDITTTQSGSIGELGVGSNGCGGELKGKVIENEDFIIILGKEDDQESPSCVVKFKKEGNKIISSDQDDGCLPYHGASCDFSEPSMKRIY